MEVAAVKQATMCILAVVAVLISTGCIASEVVMLSPPQMAIGDVFIYQTFNSLDDAKSGSSPIRTMRNTVTEVNGDGFVMSTKKANRHYNNDGNLTKRELEDKPTIVYNPCWPTYNYPIKVGDVYDEKFSHTYPKEHGDVTYHVTATVVGWETITVPAGIFKALKIEARGTYEHPPNYTTADISYTVWLAPEIKMRPILYSEVRSWNNGSESRYESLKKYASQ